jgi:aminoglycoside phosphotransferase (APT) family kinase protein
LTRPLDEVFRIIAGRVLTGGVLRRHWPLAGGVSAQVHALEVSCPSGSRRVVVRRHGSAAWKPLAHDVTTAEFRLLGALHQLGMAVPQPLHLDTSSKLLPSPFFVMGMVDGSTTIDDRNLPFALKQMAEFLAHLHRFDVHALDLPVLPRREDPIQGVLDYLPGDVAWDPLRAAVRRYTVQSNDESLLHGDYWPGNLLWNGAELAAVIDWEDAATGPALSDVACCRAELNVSFGEAAVQAFTQHYLSAHPCDISDLPLWDVYVGSAALASMHDWRLGPETEKIRRERTSLFVAIAAREFLSRYG